jgi:hypothetical protein
MRLSRISFEAENKNKVFTDFATVSKLQRSYICVTFIIVIVDLKKTICFGIMCKLSFLF